MAHAREQIVEQLIGAYRHGLFPMADPQAGTIGLYDPDPRAILPMRPSEGLHVPRRLARTVRRGRFAMTSDRAFGAVVAACARERSPRPGSRSVSAQTWISDELAQLYGLLHEAGYAHSIEAWVQGESGEALVGGIFGVCVGSVFCGESMVSLPKLGGTDASKVCLVHTIAHLRARGFTMFDTQMLNPHLEQFGCCEISRDEYHRRLARALEAEPAWQPFDADEPGGVVETLMRDE